MPNDTVPDEELVTSLENLMASAWLRRNLPAVKMVSPVKVLAAFNESTPVPVPVFLISNVPLPLMAPEKKWPPV